MNGPYISAGGLCTGVGVGVEASCAAIRAGLSGLDECPWLDDAGRPIVGVALRGFERARLGDRLLAMLAGVIEEAATRWQQRIIPCCVVAWPSAADHAVPSETELELELESRLGIEIGTLRLVLGDELASVRALSLAWQQLNAESLQACLVCGVDSWFDTVRLATLASQQRLRTLDESDGIAPGEAAASVWVTPRPAYVDAPRVLGIGVGSEAGTLLDDRPLVGLGMTQAIRGALAHARLEFSQIDFVLSDLGGETYHFTELSLATARLQVTPRDLWHPAEFVGSVGVAAGPLAWIVAEQAARGGWAPGRLVACTSSGLGSERGALLLSLPPVDDHSGPRIAAPIPSRSATEFAL